ncbi:hypothetical protein [Micromonospora zamorensis]|uniref:hypothetical protein n=1 Tax=Micromonospora zamorensis TaxID=709883 RepID=UPI0033B85053
MSGGQLKAAGMFREFGPVRSAEPQESILDSVADEELPDLTPASPRRIAGGFPRTHPRA